MVLEELRRALTAKIKVLRKIVVEIERLLREQTVVPKPDRPSPVRVRDRADRWVLASAVAGRADLLVAGDHELLGLGDSAPLPIVDPRGFWSRVRNQVEDIVDGRASG